MTADSPGAQHRVLAAGPSVCRALLARGGFSGRFCSGQGPGESVVVAVGKALGRPPTPVSLEEATEGTPGGEHGFGVSALTAVWPSAVTSSLSDSFFICYMGIIIAYLTELL